MGSMRVYEGSAGWQWISMYKGQASAKAARTGMGRSDRRHGRSDLGAHTWPPTPALHPRPKQAFTSPSGDSPALHVLAHPRPTGGLPLFSREPTAIDRKSCRLACPARHHLLPSRPSPALLILAALR